jgi:zinc D-Ala-D-Ala carboxypeptidase
MRSWMVRKSRGVLLFLAIVAPWSAGGQGSPSLPSSQQLAREILSHDRIVLATSHASGIADRATAWHNVRDVATGLLASRSAYTHGGLEAPGGMTALSPQMLWALLRIADAFSIHVSEIAGGAHGRNSRHYVGVAFDINRVNDVPVREAGDLVGRLRQLCRDLGATEILGPGDAGHAHHVHCAWPRPSS